MDGDINKLVRKMDTTERVIRSLLAIDRKVAVLEKKLTYFEELVADIPSSLPDLFDQWNEKVVNLWTAYARLCDGKVTDHSMDTSIASKDFSLSSESAFVNRTDNIEQQPLSNDSVSICSFKVEEPQIDDNFQPQSTTVNNNCLFDGSPQMNSSSKSCSLSEIGETFDDNSKRHHTNDNFENVNENHNSYIEIISTAQSIHNESYHESYQLDHSNHHQQISNSSNVQQPFNNSNYSTIGAKPSKESIYCEIEEIFSRMDVLRSYRDIGALKDMIQAMSVAEKKLHPYWRDAEAQLQVQSYFLPKLPAHMRNRFADQPSRQQTVRYMLQNLQRYLIRHYADICATDQELIEEIKLYVPLDIFCLSCKRIGHTAERCRQPNSEKSASFCHSQSESKAPLSLPSTDQFDWGAESNTVNYLNNNSTVMDKQFSKLSAVDKQEATLSSSGPDEATKSNTDPQMTKNALLNILQRAFAKLESVQTKTDMLSMRALCALTAKSRKLSEHFLPDQQLPEEIFRMASAKFPVELLAAFNGAYQRKNMDTLIQFMCSHMAESMSHMAELEPLKSRLFCTYCRTSGHKVDDCSWRKGVLCFNCFQYGHSYKMCENPQIQFEHLINLQL